MIPARVRYGLALIAVLFLAVAVIPAAAAPPAKQAAQGANGGTSPFAAQIAALKQARELMIQADHDYKGHRAEAVKLVTAAIHELHPHHKGGGATAKGAAKGATAKAHAGAKNGAANTGNSVPQAVSDANLRQAMTQISTIQTQLAGAGGPGATAAATLGKAVQELQTALSVK